VNISLPEGKNIQNISSASIWEKLQSIFQEVKDDSSIPNRKELISLLEKILSLGQHPVKNASIWTRLKYRISGKKWIFSTANPLYS
jgi:hypothetical protein